MAVVFTSLVLITPLIIAGILHMLVVRFRILLGLAHPIWLEGFGANKTWRGLVVMPVFGIAGLGLSQLGASYAPDLWTIDFLSLPTLSAGVALGLAYVLFELPNSYLKRRMGVAPGELASTPSSRRLFFVLDHVDSLTGCLLIYLVFLGPRLEILLCLVLAPLIHILINLLLWIMGIRKNRY